MEEKLTAYPELLNDVLKDASINGNFSERSEMAQEVITRKPDFVEKWALFFFLTLLMVLVACTWFIKYPDIVEGRAILTGENAPKEIVSKQNGKLVALFAKNNQIVKQGEIIGWLESNADTKEVLRLFDQISKMIENFKIISNDTISVSLKEQYVHLGELQAPYQMFIAAWQQYDDYLVNGFYKRKKGMLDTDIASLVSIKKQATAQKEFSQKDNELAWKTFEMNEKLFKDKVISAEEYRQAQSKLLNNEKAIPQTDMSIIMQENQIRDKQKEIDQIDHDILKQKIIFEQALYTFKSSIDDWLRRYTLQAPAAGRVIFMLPLQENQYVDQGKLLGYINPEDSRYFAEVRLSQNNFGKIDTGMKVQLRFDAYPYQEIGFVSGRLSYISDVAIDSGFLGTVRLDRGLITNQNKKLQYRNGLKAQALIITRDMRLLRRLYYSVVKSVSMNK